MQRILFSFMKCSTDVRGEKKNNIMWGVKEVKKIKIWTSFVISRRKASPHISDFVPQVVMHFAVSYVLFENWIIYPNWNENLN